VTDQEIWMPIPGYEGLYSVSSLGQVRAEDRAVGNGQSLKGHLMKSWPCRGQHHYIALWKNNRARRFSVHRLVAETFLGSRLGRDIHHKNGDCQDNRLCNLVYMDEGIHSSLHHQGVGNGRAILSPEDVVAIRLRYAQGDICKAALARQFGIGPAQVRRVISRESWAHIP
jgi:hypothetical protein